MSKSEENRYRSVRLYVRVTDSEKEIIKHKMEFLGIKDMSRYLRSMAVFGECHVHKYDSVVLQLKEMNYYISSISKSINQIAKAVNTTGNLYEDDFIEMKKSIEEMKLRQVEMMKSCLLSKTNREE